MNKVVINGELLRKAISDKCLTIVNAAEKGKIGEKTLHRLLKGEAIKENVVISFFQNLKLSHSEYLINNSGVNHKDSGESITRNTVAGSNSSIILFPFQMPCSTSIPHLIIWDFDIINPNKELLELFKKLNENLEEYCDAENINSLSFEGSFARLTLTSATFDIIKEIAKHKVYAFSGTYDYYKESQEKVNDFDGKEDWFKYYNSSQRLYLYFTENNLIKRVEAHVNIGKEPPWKMEDGFKNVIVNGDKNYYDDKGEINLPF